MKLQILYYGNPLLRKHCAPVTEFNQETSTLIDNMIDTLEHYNGAGLAAPQVGVAVRIFILKDYIIEGEHWSQSPDVRVYVNPTIEVLSEEVEESTEGCLSLPKIRVSVWRPCKIKVKALDREGHPFEEIVEGYNARVRLHENDHLNGVLTIDRMDAKARRILDPQLRAIKKQYAR